MNGEQEVQAPGVWLTQLQALVAGGREPPPIARTIGFVAEEIAAGRAVFTLVADMQRHANPMGTMHGGVLVDLGDAAMGFAMASTLADGESFTTIELKANYFKPVWKGVLRATGTMIKRSRTLGYLECEIVDAGGSLVCKLASTCMVLREQAAAGR
jgi:uncharacterized protein (TIGR00369 family)